MMALMIVGLMAGSAAASDWEAIGGLQIVNVTLDTYNDTIDSFNDAVEFYPVSVGTNAPISTSNLDKFDNIDRVPLLYLGAKKEINDKWDLNIRYEYIFGEVEQEYTESGISYDNSIAVDLHGLTFLADYTINENWYATGGIGYHQGTKTTDLNGPVYTAVSQDPNNSVQTSENDYDLDNGISLRAGVGYKRSFAENWDFNAQLDYLYIELDDEQQGNIYSKGFAYTAGLTYSF
jgi:hypothetical protein